MNALTRRLARTTEDAAAQLSELADNELLVVNRIMASTAPVNDLLANMVRRFASARYGSRATVLQAATDFDSVAVGAVKRPIIGCPAYVAARWLLDSSFSLMPLSTITTESMNMAKLC